MEIDFYFPRSNADKRRTYHIKKSDLDNVCKLFCDATNKILWNDDCQIIDMHARKHYVSEVQPHVGIQVYIKQLCTHEENENKIKREKKSA